MSTPSDDTAPSNEPQAPAPNEQFELRATGSPYDIGVAINIFSDSLLSKQNNALPIFWVQPLNGSPDTSPVTVQFFPDRTTTPPPVGWLTIHRQPHGFTSILVSITDRPDLLRPAWERLRAELERQGWIKEYNHLIIEIRVDGVPTCIRVPCPFERLDELLVKRLKHGVGPYLRLHGFTPETRIGYYPLDATLFGEWRIGRYDEQRTRLYIEPVAPTEGWTPAELHHIPMFLRFLDMDMDTVQLEAIQRPSTPVPAAGQTMEGWRAMSEEESSWDMLPDDILKVGDLLPFAYSIVDAAVAGALTETSVVDGAKKVKVRTEYTPLSRGSSKHSAFISMQNGQDAPLYHVRTTVFSDEQTYVDIAVDPDTILSHRRKAQLRSLAEKINRTLQNMQKLASGTSPKPAPATYDVSQQGLDETDKKIIKLFGEKPNITMPEIANSIGLSLSQSSKRRTKLAELGLVPKGTRGRKS